MMLIKIAKKLPSGEWWVLPYQFWPNQLAQAKAFLKQVAAANPGHEFKIVK